MRQRGEIRVVLCAHRFAERRRRARALHPRERADTGIARGTARQRARRAARIASFLGALCFLCLFLGLGLLSAVRVVYHLVVGVRVVFGVRVVLEFHFSFENDLALKSHRRRQLVHGLVEGRRDHRPEVEANDVRHDLLLVDRAVVLEREDERH
eukprot:Amastigsp_a526904_4.p2 type:complete len:154 gc:universal Amastigsp_a526904_4:687-226(-)